MDIWSVLLIVSLSSQLTIEASDQALPDDQVTMATVVVTVPRDRQPPRFSQPEISAQTSDTRNIGETVAQFRASDQNLAVSTAKNNSSLGILISSFLSSSTGEQFVNGSRNSRCILNAIRLLSVKWITFIVTSSRGEDL